MTGVPGASAAVLALSISGLPSDRFVFQGFLPQRPGRKISTLQFLIELDITAIVFESPHRILKTLGELEKLAPAREVFVGRELTKLHEECFWGTVQSVLAEMKNKASIKGEIVLVISRKSSIEAEEEEDEDV